MAENPKKESRLDEILATAAQGENRLSGLPLSPDQQFSLILQRSSLGSVGRFFGSRENAVIYIGALFGLIALVSFVSILAFEDPAKDNVKFAVNALPPIVLAVLGYLFGKGTQNN